MTAIHDHASSPKSVRPKPDKREDAEKHATQWIAALAARHHAEREALHKSHDIERRDLAGNHREEKAQMDARHRGAARELGGRHLSELHGGGA
jgi:hypothetical protein